MSERIVTIARIYVLESERLLDKLVKYLRDDAEVAGVTVLRAIEGFAQDGDVHSASLTDLSLALPLVIEFFDEPARVDAVVHSLLRRFPLKHIVSWQATRHGPIDQQ